MLLGSGGERELARDDLLAQALGPGYRRRHGRLVVKIFHLQQNVAHAQLRAVEFAAVIIEIFFQRLVGHLLLEIQIPGGVPRQLPFDQRRRQAVPLEEFVEGKLLRRSAVV